MQTSSAPRETDIMVHIPDVLPAPVFKVDDWNNDEEPLGMTRLRDGESFLDGAERIVGRGGGDCAITKRSNTILPGMRVSDDQIGVIIDNGSVRFRPPGAYLTTKINPWKMSGAVVPLSREAGVEFDPLIEAARANQDLANMNLGQSYRQITLQAQMVGVFEDQSSMNLAGLGTYVYCSGTSMRGVVDLNRLNPIMVERETEDTVTANSNGDQRGHGTTVQTTTRFIPAGYVLSVAGIIVARPEKGFVAMHKDSNNVISLTEGICIAVGNEDFVRRSKNDNLNSARMDDLEIEFGDLNHYAKSTPILELKSKDNLDSFCRAQIKWKQTRPDIWIAQRGAFTDPFDMLEEKLANLMRDWLLSVPHLDALEEKSQGFTRVEHQWSRELNETGYEYGVKVMGIEITTLRFPSIDQQDEQVSFQLAETNLAIEMSKQNAMKEKETSKLNQATHIRLQEDKNREAESEERAQTVQRRKDIAEAETVTKKAEMDTKVVEAAKCLALAQEVKDEVVEMAKAEAEAGAERVRAKGRRDAAQLAAEGEIAATKEKNKAQLDFLKQQAALLKDNSGLVELLRIQNDFLKTQALADAATKNPNIVLLTGQEGLESRRMINGHAPQVPGAALIAE